MLEEYRDVLKIDDIMNILQIGRNAAYKLVADGTIKSLKIGRNIRIPKKYLIDYFDKMFYNDDGDMCTPVSVEKGA